MIKFRRISVCLNLLMMLAVFSPSVIGQEAIPERAKRTGRVVPAAETPSWLMPPIDGPNLYYKTFESKLVAQSVSYLLYLPPEYATSGDRRYPVVYWLHGIGGSQQGVPGMTSSMTEAINAGKMPPMIMVFVNGMIRSSWVDSYDRKTPVESVAIKELIPHIDGTYRTIATREGRMIEGFSMGGGGAAKWGFKHTDLFGSISIVDGALHKADDPSSGRLASSFQTVYGGDRAYFEAGNPWILAEKNAHKVKDRTAVRIITRTTGLGGLNREFSELLVRLGVTNEFHAVPEVPHSPGPLYLGIGDANWAFYKKAFAQVALKKSETSRTREKNAESKSSYKAVDSTPYSAAAPTSATNEHTSALDGFQLNGERWTYRDGDFAMNGILVRPEGKGPFPAILISHGRGGSSEVFGLQKSREMVKWGFVCIAPDYTHSAKYIAGGLQGMRRPGDPADPPKAAPSGDSANRTMSRAYANYGASGENIRRAKTCLELLCKMPEVDTQRLAAYGHSMGGFVTIGLAASEPKLIKAAAISGSGVAAQDGSPAPSVARAEVIRTPFLMLHGSLDNVVRPQQSADLKEMLDKNHVPNDRMIFEGENHPVDQTKREEVFAAIRAWFEQNGVLASPLTQQEATKADGPSAATAPDGVKAYRDIAYVENGHERHKLDLFIPEGTKEPLPLIIWIHGGGWQNGSKEGCPPLRNGYTERGYAVAGINYRLSGHAVFPAQIEDCKAAIRWLRAHAAEYNLDPQRLGVWGSSAGGHLVALVGTSGDVKAFDVGANLDQSSRVQAVCDYYGPTDFTVFVTTPGYESHAMANSPEAKLIGGTVTENKDKAARVDPITYVSQDDPPFLIVHGDKDPTVPINQSQLLYDALKQAGVNVHFHTIRGAGHGQGFGGPEIEPMVADFFDRVLKSNPLPSNLGSAKTSDSDASPAPAAAKGKAGAPRGVGNMGWEQVRRIEGINDDGRVPRNQFRGPPAMFDRLDRNRDGFVSKEDFN